MADNGLKFSFAKDETAAFTGHRFSRLPWGGDELDPRCLLLKQQIEDAVLTAYAEGRRNFLCGMALGVDTYAAEAVLKVRVFKPDARLICVFPYRFESNRVNAIADHADHVIVLNKKYVTGCMQQRNRYLINRSSLLIAVYDGRSGGGTAQTIQMAIDAGIKHTIISV